MHIITSNGCSVYSTKRVCMISGALVIFPDGSFCNVKTGELANNGPEGLEIRASVDGPAYSIGPLVLDNISGISGLKVLNVENFSLEVEPHEERYAEIAVERSSDGAPDLHIDVRKGVLLIEGSKEVNTRGVILGDGKYNINIRHAQGVVIAPESSVTQHFYGNKFRTEVGEPGAQEETRITVKIPKNGSIDSDNAIGTLRIGGERPIDVDGKLRINLKTE